MSWRCVCNEEGNPDESRTCRNCGRMKPKYLGVTLETQPTEKMSKEQKAVWYLVVAYSYLAESGECIENCDELSGRLGDSNYNQAAIESKLRELRARANSACHKCLQLIEKAASLSPEAQFKDDRSSVHSISSLRSDSYFNLASICFNEGDYGKAIEHYQASYDADPNQVSIYNIVMATRNLPAEGGGLFGGKKKQTALETKRDQEIALLNRTIQFAPFSKLGVKSATKLMENYGITEFDI
jgi:tetratricopeptide (TPR) repeat protein